MNVRGAYIMRITLIVNIPYSCSLCMIHLPYANVFSSQIFDESKINLHVRILDTWINIGSYRRTIISLTGTMNLNCKTGIFIALKLVATRFLGRRGCNTCLYTYLPVAQDATSYWDVNCKFSIVRQTIAVPRYVTITNDSTEKYITRCGGQRVTPRMFKLIISDRKILIDSDTWF